MKSKRFDKLMLAFRFQRNDLPMARRAALKDYGSYDNAIRAVCMPLATELALLRAAKPREIERKRPE